MESQKHTGQTRQQKLYVLVPNDQKGLIKKCRVFNSADINSDDSILMAKYTIFLPEVKHYKPKLKRFDISKLKIEPIYNTFKIQLGRKFQPLINDVLNQNVGDCYIKFIGGVNNITKESKVTEETKQLMQSKALCEKRRSLRKKIINLKKPHAATIQEYRKVNCIVKKEVKKAKRIKLDEKIQKLGDNFRKNDLHNLFKSVHELEGKPRKVLWLSKTKMQIKGLKHVKFLKSGRSTLNSILT